MVVKLVITDLVAEEDEADGEMTVELDGVTGTEVVLVQPPEQLVIVLVLVV